MTWFRKIAPAFLAVLTIAAGGLTAAETPLEVRLLDDMSDGRLDEFSVCEGALIAGGLTDREQIELHLRRFEMLCETVRFEAASTARPRVRAAALLTCLHRELLTGPYQAADWQVGETLSSGRYNCLTATILFQELCRRCELQVGAVWVPGHVYCRLEAGGCDVETTCARWFSLDLAARSKQAPRPATPRAISDVELLAKVFYNRGLARLDAGHFADAVELLAESRRLDPLDSDALCNELAALNNWALALAEAGQFEEARKRIRQGLAIDPSSQPLRDNELFVCDEWARALRAKRQQDAVPGMPLDAK